MSAIAIHRIETFLYRAPIVEPLRTSFGTIPARPALVLRVTDADGAYGWGEVWCNFPPFGAENKAKLCETIVGPAALAGGYAGPSSAWHELTARTNTWALQIGEPGPMAACLGGLDLAIWDLIARKRGEPLWRTLGRNMPPAPVQAYASGLNPDGALETVARCRAAGFRAFKLKVGFTLARDEDNVRRVMADLRPDEQFMVDANQGWDLQTARTAVPILGAYGLSWIEEPLAADRPAVEWAELAMLSPVPLAGGENLYSFAAFDAAITAGHLGVIQPDLGKWGGLTGCLAVARRTVQKGRRYCPHWLGAGIGLLGAAHLLATVGGDGLLEHDVTENPLREVLAQPFPRVTDGCFLLPEASGLGVEPDLVAAKPWLVVHREIRRPG